MGDEGVTEAADVAVRDPDGSAGEVSGRAGRETRLDLLLAEELSVNVPFLRWFLSRVEHKPDDWPTGAPESSLLELNVWEPEPLEHAGETDVRVTLRWTGDIERRLLIEDKVFAGFQPSQGERYRGRAEAQHGLAVLVAPAGYAVPAAAASFHGRVDIDDIVQFLRNSSEEHPDDATARARLLWRATMLEQLMTRRRTPAPEHPPTVAFTRFCVDWLLEHESAALPSPASCRTVNQGWLYFTQPSGLMYKASGWGHPKQATVDLYLKYLGYFGDHTQAEADLRKLPALDGFRLDADTQDNLVLRFDCAVVPPAEGLPPEGSERRARVVEALEACDRAAVWVSRNGDELQRFSPPARQS